MILKAWKFCRLENHSLEWYWNTLAQSNVVYKKTALILRLSIMPLCSILVCTKQVRFSLGSAGIRFVLVKLHRKTSHGETILRTATSRLESINIVSTAVKIRTKTITSPAIEKHTHTTPLIKKWTGYISLSVFILCWREASTRCRFCILIRTLWTFWKGKNSNL